MKAKILTIFFLSIIACNGNLNNEDDGDKIKTNSNQYNESNSKNFIKLNTISAKEGINFLKKFYSKFYFNDNSLLKDSDRSEFLSSKILNRIEILSDPENLELDYDPFIRGQDFSGNLIKKTLIVTKIGKKYSARFKIFEEENVEIEYELGRNKHGKIEIVSILNDSLLNVK